MLLTIKTGFRHHGNDGLATAILTLHYEGDPDTRDVLETAIRAALAPKVEEPAVEDKPSRIGFDLPTGAE